MNFLGVFDDHVSRLLFVDPVLRVVARRSCLGQDG